MHKKVRSIVAVTLAVAAIISAGCAVGRAQEPLTYQIEIDATAEPKLAPTVDRLRKVFAECYPNLIGRFQNPQRPKAITIPLVFRKGMDHPAHAAGGRLVFSVEWFLQHPDDLGVMTHELTHIVQSYPRGNPGWLVEGVADYSRHLYGPKSDPWKVPARLVAGRHNYKQGYGVTARFLIWLEERWPGAVDELHARMQTGRFKMEAFEELTGKAVDLLWEECLASFK